MKDPAQSWYEAEQEAQAIQHKTQDECITELNLLHRGYAIYVDGMLAAKTLGDTDAAAVQMALISQNLNFFKAAIDLATRGYYFQARTMLRSVYENYLSFWYLDKHPDEAARWLDPKGRPGPPKAETMRNEIQHLPKELKSKLRDFYGELSKYSHPSFITVNSMARGTADSTVIGIGVEYSREDFEACTYGISLWLSEMAQIVSWLVPRANEWHHRYRRLVEDTLAYIDQYNAARADEADSKDSSIQG